MSCSTNDLELNSMHTENEPSPSDNLGLASACGNGFTASHFANGRFHPADARPLYSNQYSFRCSTLECLSLKQRPDDEVIVVWAFSKLLDFAIQLVVVRSVTRPKVGAGQTAFPDAILPLLPGSLLRSRKSLLDWCFTAVVSGVVLAVPRVHGFCHSQASCHIW